MLCKESKWCFLMACARFEWSLGAHTGKDPSPWLTQARVDAITLGISLAAATLSRVFPGALIAGLLLKWLGAVLPVDFAFVLGRAAARIE